MSLFTEFGILIGLATLVALVMRYFKQPLMIGYIITGLLAGPFVFGILHSTETLSFFSEIGIAILLFTVGLNINPKIIKDFGKVVLVSGLGQIILTFVFGYLLSLALGFTPLVAFYLGCALTFSSTIVVLKLISDKADLDSLYAKISIGILLIQDLVAIFLLFLVPIFSTSNFTVAFLLNKLSLGLLAVALILFFSVVVFPKINNFISESEELLLLLSIAWGIGVAVLFKVIGFSLESGALAAGAALATLPSRHEINARLSPLRDFFLVLFFVSLGTQISLKGIFTVIPLALIFSAFVLFGKSLIITSLLGFLGYKKKTSFQTGTINAQVSEFSLIFLALGLKLGHVSNEVLSLVTLIGLITILGSTYFVTYSEKIYRSISGFLNIFQRKHIHEQEITDESYPMILFGTGRIGYDFFELFKHNKKNFLVVDHNPNIIEQLKEQHANVLHGDASDLDLLESINFQQAKLIVSTIPHLETNLLIARVVNKQRPDPDDTILIAVSHSVDDALALYDSGYDYVVLPHFLGGSFAVELVQKMRNSKSRFIKLREEHQIYLRTKVELGHYHPQYKKL
jgi:Kef-type K+ transport system membrane component KefB/voltage-gated potassium channel Kch